MLEKNSFKRVVVQHSEVFLRTKMLQDTRLRHGAGYVVKE